MAKLNVKRKPERGAPAVIPMVDLRPLLRAAGGGIRARLAEMHAAGQYILGAQVSGFESEFASATGALSCVGVGTGTAALELALRSALGRRKRREVVVPALTSLFTAQAVLAAGGRLSIADVDEDSLLLTSAGAEAAWGPSTTAVAAVHLYGRPCRLEPLMRLAGGKGAALIQDACQAHGARHLGRPLTDFSPYVCYSFYPTKNLGCLGDGGGVATSSPLVERLVRLLRDGGRAGGQVAGMAAGNSRLDEMHACYLRGLLPGLEASNERRARVAARYYEALRGCPGLRLPAWSDESVHHLFVVRAKQRTKLREHLLAAGIQTGIHYPVPLHRHPAFRDARVAAPPVVAERACREILSLPIGVHIRPRDAERVAAEIRRFYT
ncbi:DegT/DnrJ/EryC1/StrS family aminotransferase [Paludibaculum fermentans]|uniref:DegT/DnrJ/EryC1/StrS family aminotransferase n=1 Tax=Paludibaculum fermentans TaxID=1473598 RepID=UPI003EBC39CA